MKQILEEQYRQYETNAQLTDEQLAERIIATLPDNHACWQVRVLRLLRRDDVSSFALWVVIAIVCGSMSVYMFHHMSYLTIAVTSITTLACVSFFLHDLMKRDLSGLL